MYTIDLSTITIDEFETILKPTTLSPGRRILLDDLSATLTRFKQSGILTLADLQALLRNKKTTRPSPRSFRSPPIT